MALQRICTVKRKFTISKKESKYNPSHQRLQKSRQQSGGKKPCDDLVKSDLFSKNHAELHW